MSCAICCHCGALKSVYSEQCASCGFEPITDEEIAASLVLSSEFQLDSAGLPKSDAALRELGNAIASGQRNVISMDDMEAVKAFLLETRKFQARCSLGRVIAVCVLPVMLLLVFLGYVLRVIVQS